MHIANTDHEGLPGPGVRLGRYEILVRLAEGGMATVWAARPVEGHGSARVVVLKTIRQEFVENERFRELFLREGGIALRISHRNVARIFDIGEGSGTLYIAMEFVDGPPLSQLRRLCRAAGVEVPARLLLRILADTCGGLHAAHELRDGTGKLLNVVHRDISPSNILVSAQGVAKVIDFGVATTQFGVGQGEDSELVGKMGYMAPEQALGMAVDRRADVWSIGAILYHVLSGVKPYDAPNWHAKLQLLASGQAPKPLPPVVPVDVAAVVGKALAYAPADRFVSAEQLREAIEAAMRSSNQMATVADVAAFFKQHVADHSAGQRRSVESALATASERELTQDPADQTPTLGSHGRSRAPELRPVTPDGSTTSAAPSEPRTGLFATLGRWFRS